MSGIPGHQGPQHFLFKRWKQWEQSRGEQKGVRVGTDFAEEFKQMQQMSMAMEKAYRKIPEKLEMYLQPDPTKRINAKLFNKKEQVLTDDMVDRENLSKVGDAMMEAGRAFGEETSLGSLYMVVGEAQKEITKSWLTFQFEASKKYLKPLGLFVDDLKDVKKNLEKIEKDRLYLDATKARGQAAKTNIRKFDPSEVKHLETKAQKLHASLEEKAGNVQEQMEQFFYELEDDQMLILQNFISAEIDYHRQALEALADVGAFINYLAQQPIQSILKHTRGDTTAQTRGQQARAVYDFNATNADEVGFQEGDIITVVSTDVGQDGWWLGDVDGQQGLIPSNYVELIEHEEPPINVPVLMQPLPTAAGLGSNRRGSAAAPQPAVLPVRDEQAMREREQLAKELATLKAQKEKLLAESKKLGEQAKAEAAVEMQKGMFGTALDMALRQVAGTKRLLEDDRKAVKKPEFKANPSQFDSAFEALMGKAQDVMNVVKAILKDAQGGSLPDLQLQITQAIEELQRKSTAAEARSQITPRLALDAKQMSASLLRPEDRDAVLLATSGIITSLEGMLGALKKSAGQPKETVKAQLSPGSKQAAAAIGNLLDKVEVAKSNQLADMKKLEAEAKAAESKQEQELLQAARQIARVAEELAAIQRASSTAPVHKSMVGEAQQVTGTTAKLVQVATECQRVIANAQGSGATGQKGRAYYADGTWSEGLVSAAKMVADGVEDLLEAANAVVSGGQDVDLSKVDRLRAVAQSINASTIQVVMAGSARNPDRGLHGKLQEAGNDVQRAVDKMVREMNANKAYGAGVNINADALTATQRRKAEIEAQSKILKAQRDLEQAQKELMALRKGRYADSGSAGENGSSAPKPATPPPAAGADDDDEDDDLDAALMARLNKLKGSG